MCFQSALAHGFLHASLLCAEFSLNGGHPYRIDGSYVNPIPYPTSSTTTVSAGKDTDREKEKEREREREREREKNFIENSPDRSHNQQLPGSAPLGGPNRTPSSSIGSYVTRQNSSEVGVNLSPGMMKKSLSDGPVPFLPSSSSITTSFSPFVSSPTRNIDTSGTFNHPGFGGLRRSFEKDKQEGASTDHDIKLLPRFPFRIGSKSRTSSPIAGGGKKDESAYSMHMDGSLSPTQEAQWDAIQGSFRLRSRRGSFADALHTGSAVTPGTKISTDIRNSSSNSNSTDDSCGVFTSSGLEAR
jgi:hypothetical protein